MKNIKSAFFIFHGIYEPLLGAFVFLLWGVVTETAPLLIFTTDDPIGRLLGTKEYIHIQYDYSSKSYLLF